MKKKFSKILGVGLTVALLSSLILIAAPVSAGTLGWTAFSPVPSETNQVLEPSSNVTDFGMDADGDTIYAAGGSNLLYKSTDGGVTWSTIDFWTKSSENVTDLVAVAPDDGDIVAVADTTLDQVWISTDGGTTWGTLGNPAEGGVNATDIRDIAMSAESAGIHYIAVGGIDSSGESGNVSNMWHYNVGAAAPVWTATKDLGGFQTGNVTAAVEFSPNFPSDQVLTAVSTNETDVVLQLFDFNRDKWNADAVFADYPALIVTDSDNAITDLTSASIGLDPEYLGSDDAMRISFIGLTVATTTALSGIYRMDDATTKALKDGTTVDVHSITYDGSIVVAGRYSTNAAWYCLDPLATSPTVSGTSTLKRPGGTQRVVVAWMGGDVVAGTSGPESAFAISRNDAKSFNDISLIDTTLASMTDVVVSADGSITYLATGNGTTTARGSVWSYAEAWERVLSSQNYANFIIRVAPDDPEVVYVAVEDGETIYYSGDAGQTRWQTRTSRYPVQDLAVETDGGVAYVLIETDGKVSKSTNSGFTWGTSKSSKLNDGYTIASLGEDKVLVGSQDGYVSYSTDGHDSFTKISKVIETGATLVQVTASGLATDDYIYAASNKTDTKVLRWQLGTSTSWKDLKAPTSANYTATGIALQDDVLYVMTGEIGGTDNNSATLRTLSPTSTVPSGGIWSTMVSADEAFNLTPQALKVGGGSTILWAIDTDTNSLWSYTDTLTDAAPALISPKHGSSVAVNPVTGYARDITFTWGKPSDDVTGYYLEIALDEAFYEKAMSLPVLSTKETVGVVVGPSGTKVLVGLTTIEYSINFMPGETYYWRVRVAPSTMTDGTMYGPIYSPYSIVYTLTVEEAVAPFPEITVEPAPAPPAPEVTVQPPDITVTVPPITIPAAPAIPAYLLWTIIGIGAVLIIALIVLIVRTRRVV